MVALVPSQDLPCKHIQVPQLSPSSLHSHEPISQKRYGQGVDNHVAPLIYALEEFL